MMSKKWFLIISFILLMGTVYTVKAEPFALQATSDLDIGNDPGLAPTDRENTEGLHIRNIATRRRVAYVRYDIQSLKEPGKVLFNASLNILGTKDRTGPVSVWGIKEDLDHTIDPNTICWNNAPGVMNDPMPPLDMPVELDYADLSSPVLIASFNGILNGTRVSTPLTQALDDFLNSDTDGIIVLMFAETGVETASAIVRPTNYTTAGSGYGTPELYGIVLTGEKGVLRQASRPLPTNYSTAPISTSQLSWTKPDPNLPGGIITSDVYFHVVDNDPNTSDDPNYALPNYGYTTLATGTANNFVSLPAPLEREKTYYWIVDTHDPGCIPEKTRGSLWTFNTNNMAPGVNAGDNQYLWLNNDNPPSVTVSLDAVVTDDDYPNPSTTILWTQDSGPAVTISPNNVNPITLTLTQIGTYRFRLTANDGALSGSGVIQVYVGATPCAAAQAKPGYTAFAGDFNADCLVSMSDFASLAQNWLDCNYLPLPCN